MEKHRLQLAVALAAVSAYASYTLAVAAHSPESTPAMPPGRLFVLIIVSVAVLLYLNLCSTSTNAGSSNFAAYRAGQVALSKTDTPPDHIRYEHERLDVGAMGTRADDFLR